MDYDILELGEQMMSIGFLIMLDNIFNRNILVIHCSSGANNVVITSNSIFGFAARPSCY